MRSWYLTKKSCARARLAADVVQHRADLRVHVRHLVQHLAEPAEVVGVPAHVRGDEGRLRIAAEQIVALRHQLLEVRKLSGGYATAREQRELEPALVGVVDRLVELLRIAPCG